MTGAGAHLAAGVVGTHQNARAATVTWAKAPKVTPVRGPDHVVGAAVRRNAVQKPTAVVEPAAAGGRDPLPPRPAGRAPVRAR
ncbi:hypothetical protein ACWCPM_13985, partial [Streptomyces sp. NPDC002309]